MASLFSKCYTHQEGSAPSIQPKPGGEGNWAHPLSREAARCCGTTKVLIGWTDQVGCHSAGASCAPTPDLHLAEAASQSQAKILCTDDARTVRLDIDSILIGGFCKELEKSYLSISIDL